VTYKNLTVELNCPETQEQPNYYWRKPPSREKLANKELYTTCGTKCYKLTADTVQEVIELKSEHEEADTRLLLLVSS